MWILCAFVTHVEILPRSSYYTCLNFVTILMHKKNIFWKFLFFLWKCWWFCHLALWIIGKIQGSDKMFVRSMNLSSEIMKKIRISREKNLCIRIVLKLRHVQYDNLGSTRPLRTNAHKILIFGVIPDSFQSCLAVLSTNYPRNPRNSGFSGNAPIFGRL